MNKKRFSIGFIGNAKKILGVIPLILDFAFERKFKKIVFFFYDKKYAPRNLLSGKIKTEKHISLSAFSKTFDSEMKKDVQLLFDHFGFVRLELRKGKIIAQKYALENKVKKPESGASDLFDRIMALEAALGIKGESETIIHIDREGVKVMIHGLSEADFNFFKKKFSAFEILRDNYSENSFCYNLK